MTDGDTDGLVFDQTNEQADFFALVILFIMNHDHKVQEIKFIWFKSMSTLFSSYTPPAEVKKTNP